MLPTGILDGSSSGVPLREAQNPMALIKTFEDAKSLDRVNEKMPARKNSTPGSDSKVETPKTSVASAPTSPALAKVASSPASSTAASTVPSLNNSNHNANPQQPTTPEQNKSYTKKVT